MVLALMKLVMMKLWVYDSDGDDDSSDHDGGGDAVKSGGDTTVDGDNRNW